MQEIWKDVPNYNGKYRVSNLGNVISVNYLNTGKDHPLSLKHHHTGYLMVRLCSGDRKHQKNRTVHSLVAESFIPNPDNKRCINHIDGNKTNNRADNLEWVTHKENTQHAIKTGLQNPHDNNHPHGKNVVNSREIYQYSVSGEFITSWECISDAARYYGMNPCMIINNASGRTKSAYGYVWKYKRT